MFVRQFSSMILSLCNGEKLHGFVFAYCDRFPSTPADNRRMPVCDRAAVAKRPGQFSNSCLSDCQHPSQGEFVLLASTIGWAKGSIMSTNMSRMFFAESHASTSQECQRKAAECLRLVRTLRDSENKAILLEMAEAWISLAEQQRAEVKRGITR